MGRREREKRENPKERERPTGSRERERERKRERDGGRESCLFVCFVAMDGARDQEIQQLLEQLHLKEKEEAVRKKHTFWESQPVKQFSEEQAGDDALEEGPVQALSDQDVTKVKKDSYTLPGGYEWCDCNISNGESVQ